MIKIAFGCSHTYGTGVERIEAWPHLLGATNFGTPGCSSDFVARTIPIVVADSLPDVIYVLWPDWTRFEYTSNGIIMQSLPGDKNRIDFMEMATEEWLHNNFNKQVKTVREFCTSKNIKLVELTLDDLIQYIDHADRWPLSKLGHHYSPVWHTWVADIFRQKENDKT